MREIFGVDELKSLAGTEVGVGNWMHVTQDRINLFADATGDHQWIHVDSEQAANGPFGSTVAHGYLTLALLPPLMNDVCIVKDRKMGLNYGLNRVRFPSPVPVNSRIRARVAIDQVEDTIDGGVQVQWRVTVELEGSEKPACVAEPLVRLYF